MDALGCPAITAMTVQSTQGVAKVEALKPSLITATLETLANDLDIDAVHIGMLAYAEVAQAVATFLAKAKLPNIVLDPILKSSSGADLLDKPGRAVLVDRLFPLAAIITPNAAEASALTGLPVTAPEQMEAAAAKLHSMGAKAVVVTGGDLEKAIDVLSFPGKKGFEREVFKAERQKSKSTHWNRMRLLHRHRLPPGPKAQSAGSSLLSQGLRKRSHRQRRPHGQGHRPGQSLVSDE